MVTTHAMTLRLYSRGSTRAMNRTPYTLWQRVALEANDQIDEDPIVALEGGLERSDVLLTHHVERHGAKAEAHEEDIEQQPRTSPVAVLERMDADHFGVTPEGDLERGEFVPVVAALRLRFVHLRS